MGFQELLAAFLRAEVPVYTADTPIRSAALSLARQARVKDPAVDSGSHGTEGENVMTQCYIRRLLEIQFCGLAQRGIVSRCAVFQSKSVRKVLP